MSDSSSKSDGYSSFLRDAAVPSTPICCYVIFTILFSYRNITGFYGSLFTYISIILLLITLSLTTLRYKDFFNSKLQFIIYTLILLLASGYLHFFLHNKISDLISDQNYPDSINNISADIDEVNFKRYSSELHFSTSINEGQKLKGIIYFQGENIPNEGDSIFIHKKIYKTVSDNKNPFSSFLISRGIHYSTGASDNDITILKKNNLSSAASLQKSLLVRIDSIFKQPAAGVIKALLSGNQNYIDKNVIIKFRNSGVLHTLSASGMHVAIFAAIPAFLLLPFFRKNIAMLGSFSSVIFYLFITDMPSSLLRAVIMFGFFYFQLMLSRKRNVFNYLMLTCIIILVISPWEIFNPGFQLSFTATAGILIFYKPYRLSLKNLPGIIADTTAVTLSAQIFTLPIIIYHMNQLNTAGVASNIIIIPLITIIMGFSLFTILVSYISLSAAFLSSYITDFIFKISMIITGFISELKLNFYIYDMKPALIILLLIGLIPLINYKKIIKLRFYPVLISVILCTIYLKKNFSTSNSNYIIKSGNSTAEIKTENEKQILKLDLNESADTAEILSEIKMKNPDIKIIELAENSNTGLLCSKSILNDYIVEEYRFSTIPAINGIFKKIIFQLEKDNVIVKFN